MKNRYILSVMLASLISLCANAQQDRFQILASDDDGLTFTLVKDYLIGDQGELNTGGNKG